MNQTVWVCFFSISYLGLDSALIHYKDTVGVSFLSSLAADALSSWAPAAVLGTVAADSPQHCPDYKSWVQAAPGEGPR